MEAADIEISESLIYKGITRPELKRKIKKKFDNLVAEIRKESNLSPTFNKRTFKIKKKKRIYFSQSNISENESEDEKSIKNSES